jgi:D-alanine-D-alanine ligase
VTPVTQATELGPALALARSHDHDVLVETLIRGGEYTLAVVDGIALPAIRLETPRVFYDYEAKYDADSTRYLCPAGLNDAQEQQLAALALAACEALGATGWSRIDFMLDEQARPYLIELNAVPGMTDHSLVPLAARVAGWSFEYLVFRILAACQGAGK